MRLTRRPGRRRMACLALVLAPLPLAGCAGRGEVATTTGPTIEIASDLPLEGDVKASSEETNKALQLYLSQIHDKVGRFTVSLKTYNDATAAKGSWDDETCVKNAHDHLRSAEVAVLGTYNSGCARLMVPVMNQASDGPLTMVSHANSNPGLTKTWGPNEPQKFAPTGRRSFARVTATDDQHGNAAVGFLKGTLHVSSCYLLSDGQLYGKGVAQSFERAARQQGIAILGSESWDLGQPSYVPFFRRIQALHPDCVYLAGVYENKGKRLIQDKVEVLGDNSTVTLMAPDGFSGYPEMDALPQAKGTYLTFGGLSTEQLVKDSPVAASFVTAYKDRYGAAPTSSYPLYGVAALQVILAAIESSDGTRKGVHDAILGASDLTVPAATSILGQAITINHATGDPVASAMTILQIRGGTETLVSSQTVS